MPISLEADDAASLTFEQVRARLEACCIAVGYLTDSGRFKMKDEVQPEVPKLVELLRRIDEVQAFDKLLEMTTSHSSSWVRYFCAMNVASTYPTQVQTVLATIKEEQGLVAAAADLALFQLFPPSVEG